MSPTDIQVASGQEQPAQAQPADPFFERRLTAKVARARGDQIVKDAEPARLAADAQMRLGRTYAYGSQWAYPQLADGKLQVVYMRPQLVDASSTKLVISINHIRPNLKLKLAGLALPDLMAIDAVPASEDPSDYNAAAVGREQARWLQANTGQEEVFGAIKHAALVYGWCYGLIRRRIEEDSIPLFDDDGEVVLDENDQPVLVHANTLEVAPLDPNMASFDPANTSPLIRDHHCFVISLPMTYDEVLACYGVDLRKRLGKVGMDQLKTTMGDLVKGSNEYAMLSHPAEADVSKTPAILVRIAYWRDPTDWKRWPTMTAWTPQIEGERGNIYHGDNPIQCRPLFRFNWWAVPGQFEAQGLPHELMSLQDYANVTATQEARTTASSGPKWMNPRGALSPNDKKALMSNEITVVDYQPMPNVQEPHPVRGIDPPQTLRATAEWLRQLIDIQANTSAIARGESPTKRDISTDSLAMLASRGDAVLEHVAREWTAEWQQMQAGLVFAAGRLKPRYQLRAELGQAFTVEMLDDFVAACRGGRFLDFRLEKNSLMPLSRQLRYEFYLALRQQGALERAEDRQLVGELTGFWVNEIERQVTLLAVDERRRLAAGMELDAAGLHDRHELIIPKLLELYHQPGFKQRYPDRWGAVGQRINERIAKAAELQVIMAQLAGEVARLSQPGQPPQSQFAPGQGGEAQGANPALPSGEPSPAREPIEAGPPPGQPEPAFVGGPTGFAA